MSIYNELEGIGVTSAWWFAPSCRNIEGA